MEKDYDVTVNNASFIFIDTMFWFDIKKDKKLHNNFKAWMKKEKYEPIFHSNLLFELFHSSKTFDFDDLWIIIKNYCFSNFSPITLIEKEIHMMYSEGEIKIDEFLHDAVFKLSKSNQKKVKDEYLQNSKYFRVYKENKGAVTEAYLKGLNKLTPKKTKGTIEDLLREKTDPKFFNDLKDSTQNNVRLKDKTKYSLVAKTNKLVDSFKNEEHHKTIKHINNLIDSGFYEKKEILKIKASDFALAIQYLELLKMSFEESYPYYLWDDFIKNLKKRKLIEFPGHYVMTEVSKLIRTSSAKVKVSDSADFENLTYLPYCDLYVSDAHIIDSIKQFDKNYSSKVLSIKQFKEVLNKTPQ